MFNKILETLRISQLCDGLDHGQLETVAAACTRVCYESGEVVFRQDEQGDSMFLVARGRVKISVVDSLGDERFVDCLTVGQHYGETGMLTGDHRTVTMTTMMDTEMLEMKREDAERLLKTIPGLAANACLALGYRLKRETAGRRPRSVSRVIGLVNNSAATQNLVHKLATELANEGETIRVLTENTNSVQRSRSTNYFAELIPSNLSAEERSNWIHDRLAHQAAHEGHTIINLAIGQNTGSDELSIESVLVQCDQVWWLSEPKHVADAERRLRHLLDERPNLPTEVHLGWILNPGFSPREIPVISHDGVVSDLKLILTPGPQLATRLERMSLSRLVRFIRKTRIGLALGGGAARGLAHLGVIKALENEGIYVDTITGTSAGALIALPYSYGWDADYMIDHFKRDLTPGRFFRMLPKGREWYMLYQFRTGGWEELLRRHFADITFEQLLIPLSTVSADLISGQQVVSQRGDAVQGVLESINLPQLSRPILRDGMALVDGGILNNVPSDLLAERGADVVVGVDIAAQMAKQFAGNTPGLPRHEMRRPRQLQTIMRTNEVQDHLITALRTKTVDQMITVDTSAFDFTDFTKAPELAAVGQRATEQAMPQIKALLEKQKQSHVSSYSRSESQFKPATKTRVDMSAHRTRRSRGPRRHTNRLQSQQETNRIGGVVRNAN